jgi:hypothetical protein
MKLSLALSALLVGGSLFMSGCDSSSSSDVETVAQEVVDAIDENTTEIINELTEITLQEALKTGSMWREVKDDNSSNACYSFTADSVTFHYAELESDTAHNPINTIQKDGFVIDEFEVSYEITNNVLKYIMNGEYIASTDTFTNIYSNSADIHKVWESDVVDRKWVNDANCLEHIQPEIDENDENQNHDSTSEFNCDNGITKTKNDGNKECIENLNNTTEFGDDVIFGGVKFTGTWNMSDSYIDFKSDGTEAEYAPFFIGSHTYTVSSDGRVVTFDYGTTWTLLSIEEKETTVEKCLPGSACTSHQVIRTFFNIENSANGNNSIYNTSFDVEI